MGAARLTQSEMRRRLSADAERLGIPAEVSFERGLRMTEAEFERHRAQWIRGVKAAYSAHTQALSAIEEPE